MKVNEPINPSNMAQEPAPDSEAIKEPQKRVHGVFPYRDDAFEAQYAIFSAALDQLRSAAVTLDGFDLQVCLKWKKNPDKETKPDQLKFPELPRYVSDDVARMIMREESRQRPDFKRTQELHARKRQEQPPENQTIWHAGKMEQQPPASQIDVSTCQPASRDLPPPRRSWLGDPESAEPAREMVEYDRTPKFPPFIDLEEMRKGEKEEREQREELLRLIIGMRDGTVDENDPRVKDLREMKKYDMTPKFPSFFDPQMSLGDRDRNPQP